eukprot:149165_1
MATNVTQQYNITTRQQLIEVERNTRKLAHQKRNERKDAFLSAQKQLLKTTEYIQQLEKLSHTLTENIEDTYNLLNNVTITNMTHHFDKDINKFNSDNKEEEHNYECNMYNVDALIKSFEDINLGNNFYNESYLMNTIDIPFLSTSQDIPLFMDKIQSCLYSCCIYIKYHNNKDTDMDIDSVQSNSISNDEYSYLNVREISIERLLHFMLIYPKQNKDKHAEYYENILPFCF